MKSLNILVVLLLAIANFECILSQNNGNGNDGNLDEPTTPDPCEINNPECYRNPNGMCRFFKNPCETENIKNKFGQVITWTKTDIGNCARRGDEETKVCQLDCNFYLRGYCYPTGTPVCGYSPQNKQCKLFTNLCSLKQDACRYPGTKDWRVADMKLCSGLRANGPAVACA